MTIVIIECDDGLWLGEHRYPGGLVLAADQYDQYQRANKKGFGQPEQDSDLGFGAVAGVTISSSHTWISALVSVWLQVAPAVDFDRTTPYVLDLLTS
jgi:hypothetical protein